MFWFPMTKARRLITIHWTILRGFSGSKPMLFSVSIFSQQCFQGDAHNLCCLILSPSRDREWHAMKREAQQQRSQSPQKRRGAAEQLLLLLERVCSHQTPVLSAAMFFANIVNLHYCRPRSSQGKSPCLSDKRLFSRRAGDQSRRHGARQQGSSTQVPDVWGVS